jgi:hypothetical protein
MLAPPQTLEAIQRALEYAGVGLASMVLDYRLSPRAIVSLMRISLHPKSAEHCALLLTVAGLADPDAWHGERLREAVIELLDDFAERFERLNRLGPDPKGSPVMKSYNVYVKNE